MPHVWVIEMFNNGQWEPCAHAKLTREEARYAKHCWEMRNPFDKFRVAKYFRGNFRGE